MPDRAAYLGHYRELFGDDALARIAAQVGVTPQAEVRYSHAAELRFGS
jgi:hypothetical protein